MIDGDPNDPIFQIRLTIGDVVDPYYISDDVLNYIYSVNTTVQAASIQAVQYLISYFSRMFDQEVGDVRFKWSDLRKNYKELLDDLTSNVNMGGTAALHYFGGTDLTEIERVKNANVVQPRVTIGMFSDVCPTGTYTLTNPYTR